MTNDDSHALLLKDFGKIVELDLAFDEHGMCFLMIDETMVSVRSLNGVLVLYAILGEFPEVWPASFWKHLLSLNATLMEAQHGAITVDEDTDAVTLMQSFTGESMTPNSLAEALRVFIAQAQQLINVLSTRTAVSAPLAPEENFASSSISDQHFGLA